jgi:hypothetical protein
MRVDLPLAVLGKLGPILSWVEASEGVAYPQAWQDIGLDFKERERAWLVHELPSYSYDTIDEILTFARPPTKGQRVSRDFSGHRPSSRRPTLRSPSRYDLGNVFDSLAGRYFAWSGGRVAVRERKMVELHELGLRFPTGHLVQHARATAVAKGIIDQQHALNRSELVSLLPSNSYGLRTVIRKGLSEGHLHLQGVPSAEESWPDVLLKNFQIQATGHFPEHEKRLMTLGRFSGRTLALAVLLGLLAEQGKSIPSIHSYFRLLDSLDSLYFARDRQQAWHLQQRLLHEVVEHAVPLLGGPACLRNSIGPNRELLWLLHWIVPASAFLERILDGASSGDLLERRGTQQRREILERLHFHAHRLLLVLPPESAKTGSKTSSKTNSKSRVRTFLHEAFFRYLVIRTHYWQMVTQQGKTTGLQHFKKFYDSPLRKSPLASASEGKRLIFERLQGWRGLRVLEGRIAPPERIADLRPWLRGYAEGADQQRISKFGLVVHFIKAEKRESNASRRAAYPHLRFGKIRRRTRLESFRLFRLLSTPHPAVPFIVGIDAANLELTTPPEVYAPAFRFLRSAPIELRRSPYRHLRPLDVERSVRVLAERRRLGMTYHVGEDFRHLLSGLRAIHEVLEYLKPQPGDRLGHATALGLDPAVWASQSGFQAVMPRGERLDDLVWVHNFLGPGDDLVGELGIEDEIQRLSWRIYSAPGKKGERRTKDWSPLALHDAWRLRQLDPYSLDLENLKDGIGRVPLPVGKYEAHHHRWWQMQQQALQEVEEFIGSAQAYDLLRAYWFDKKARKAGDEVILVELEPQQEEWLELCRRVQEKLVDTIQQREVVIEVNPSVNRVIGPMSRLDEHHIFQLTLNREQRLKRQIRVTINTDNPAVFNTSLAHEYYLLGEVLLRRKVPEPEVVEWLEWLRQNGEDYSFVRQMPDSRDPDLRRILEFIRSARPSVREPVTRRAKHAAYWQWHRQQGLPLLSRRGDLESMHRRVQHLEGKLNHRRQSTDIGELDTLQRELNDLRQDLSRNSAHKIN